MKSLLLNPETWDLTLDIDGNIAVAQDPYSVAQDVASALRVFKGELWYDTAQGVPYFQSLFGRRPAISQMKAAFVAAAKTVSGVQNAVCFIQSISGRLVTGQVQVTLVTGDVIAVPLQSQINQS